jgi:hypothetical protein
MPLRSCLPEPTVALGGDLRDAAQPASAPQSTRAPIIRMQNLPRPAFIKPQPESEGNRSSDSNRGRFDDAQDGMQAPDADPSVFQMSRAAGEMLCFAALDIDKRVTALRDAMDRPTATIVRIEDNECA